MKCHVSVVAGIQVVPAGSCVLFDYATGGRIESNYHVAVSDSFVTLDGPEDLKIVDGDKSVRAERVVGEHVICVKNTGYDTIQVRAVLNVFH